MLNADTLRPAIVAAAELARRNAGAGLPAKLARKAIATTVRAMLDALNLTPQEYAGLIADYVNACCGSTPRPRSNPPTTDEE